MIHIPKPFWLVAPSTNNFQGRRGEMVFIIILLLSISVSSGLTYSEPSVNSATKLARTCPFIAVQGRCWMSNALNIVPHFATFSM